MKRKNSNHVPLIVEPHPDDYEGYPFITLIQYRDKHILTIVDNTTDKLINAFVLDFCAPEGINEEFVVSIVSEWYDTNSSKYPISVEFSKRGMSSEMSKIMRAYNIDYVKRVIGPLPQFNMTVTQGVKKRKRRTITSGVAIRVNNHYEVFVPPNTNMFRNEPK